MVGARGDAFVGPGSRAAAGFVTMQDAKEPEPERSYAMESSGCISLMDGDGQPSFLGCMLSCMERPVTEDEGAKPSQAAGDILAQAEVEERKGNYSAASELYRRALRLDPSNATAHNNFGYLCSTHTRDFANAEYHYKLAIKCSPDYALAHNNLAYFLKKNKRDLEGAERHYREAIRCDPHYAFAHSNLGVLLKSKRDFEGAERHYLAAIRSNPRYAPAFLNYSLLLKNYDEVSSRDYLDEAVRIDPALSETPAAKSLARAFGSQRDAAREDKELEHYERLSSKSMLR